MNKEFYTACPRKIGAAFGCDREPYNEKKIPLHIYKRISKLK